VWALAADPAGHWLASAGDDGTVRLWDPIAGTSVAGLRVDGAVRTCIAVGSTGLIAAGGPRGLYLFQLVT
jgi:WD40 repeat protein